MSALPPFHPNAFASEPAGPVLLGGRCRACGHVFHPRPATCLNCLSSEIETLRLAREGRLECFTTVHMPTPTMTAPYTVGYVWLPDGLRVFAPIKAGAASLKVGMAMRLTDYVIGRGEGERLAYGFAPVEGTA